MKAKILTLLVLLCVWAGTAIYDRTGRSGQIANGDGPQLYKAEMAPDILFMTRDGVNHRLYALHEKGVVLHFWASWCAPCIVEFPELLRQVQASHGNLALVAVSIDDDPKEMERFLGRMEKQGNDLDHPNLYIVWDKNKNISLKSFNTTNVPETILIDQDHSMTDKIIGDPGWDKPENAKRLRILTQKK